MRLSTELIKSLKILLKEQYGLEYSDEQTQEAGVAIMRFVLVKAQRKQELTKKGHTNGTQRQLRQIK